MDGHAHDVGPHGVSDAMWECVGDLLTRGGGTGRATVIGLPHVGELRSLVVIEDRRAAARLVQRQFGSDGLRRRLQSAAIASLIITGLAGRIPALHAVVPDLRLGLGYHDWLLQALPGGARVGAVLLGPPRANRKPVVLLTNVSGRLMAVAKFGVTAVTRPLVRHEAIALMQICAPLRDTLHVPKLLASGPVGAGEAMLMAPLPAIVSGARPTRAALIELVRAVGRVDRRPGPTLREVAIHPRLAPLRPRIEETAERVKDVQIGSFHGDLHPGNLAMARDGRAVLWDWERWGHGAPLGFDLLHHDLQSWIAHDGVAPREAASALIARSSVILEPLGILPLQAPDVARDYLIRLAARYAADQQDRAGSILGSIETWLFPAVLGAQDDRESR